MILLSSETKSLSAFWLSDPRLIFILALPEYVPEVTLPFPSRADTGISVSLKYILVTDCISWLARAITIFKNLLSLVFDVEDVEAYNKIPDFLTVP